MVGKEKEEEKYIEVYKEGEFSKWLDKNHVKEKRIGLIIHKKHTGKGFPTHKELMLEAICYGWIDTTLRRIDDDRYVRFFCKRNKNSNWSYNTLGYAKELVKLRKMKPFGMEMYELGKKKLPHDHGIPKDPDMIPELEKELKKNGVLKVFDSLAPSMRRTYLRMILRAKQDVTKKKRINETVERMREGKLNLSTSLKVND